jgi:hypothetical protein
MIDVTPKEMDAVLKLPAPKRYEHFIKRVADTQRAWGLYQAGWALAGDADQNQLFLLWPAREYAQLVASGEWQGYEPKELTLEELLSELLPRLIGDGVGVGVFFGPDGQGVTPSAQRLRADLENELAKYPVI